MAKYIPYNINKRNIVYGTSQAADIPLFIFVQHTDSTADDIYYMMYGVYGDHFLIIADYGSTEEGCHCSLLCVHIFVTAAVRVHVMNYPFSTAYTMYYCISSAVIMPRQFEK